MRGKGLRGWRWGAATVFGLVTACGGKSRVERGGDFGDVPPISSENFAEVTARSMCESLEGCCAAWGAPYDPSRCEGFLESSFAPTVELVRSGGAMLDETSARGCVAELASVLSSCRLDNPPSCRRALAGTTRAGEPCTTGEQCVEPADGEGRCLSEETCSFRSRARLGEPCRETCREQAVLRDGFWPVHVEVYCQLGAVAAGGACFRNDGLYCPRSGRCEPLLDEGAACTSGACQMHLVCDSGICRPRAVEGQSCPSTMNSIGEPPCDDDHLCDTDDRCRLNEDNGALFYDSPETVCGG